MASTKTSTSSWATAQPFVPSWSLPTPPGSPTRSISPALSNKSQDSNSRQAATASQGPISQNSWRRPSNSNHRGAAAYLTSKPTPGTIVFAPRNTTGIISLCKNGGQPQDHPFITLPTTSQGCSPETHVDCLCLTSQDIWARDKSASWASNYVPIYPQRHKRAGPVYLSAATAPMTEATSVNIGSLYTVPWSQLQHFEADKRASDPCLTEDSLARLMELHGLARKGRKGELISGRQFRTPSPRPEYSQQGTTGRPSPPLEQGAQWATTTTQRGIKRHRSEDFVPLQRPTKASRGNGTTRECDVVRTWRRS